MQPTRFGGHFAVFKQDIARHQLLQLPVPTKEGNYGLAGPVPAGYPDGILLCNPEDDQFVKTVLDQNKLVYHHFPSSRRID